MAFGFRLSKTVGALVLAAALAALGSDATATSVQPVVVDLQISGSRMSQVLAVENTSTAPLPVEIRVQEADYTENGIRITDRPSDDLLIFPPQAIIAPGRTQSFRLQYVGDPNLQRSRHYYVTVAQLPVRLPEGQTAVQVLYNFQVVVGVSVPGVRSALRMVRAEISTEGDGQPHLVLIVENSARTYGYLAEGSLRIVQRDASGAEIFAKSLTSDQIAQQIGLGLVGAEQTRRIVTPIVLPLAGGIVEAQYTPRRL